VVILQHKAMIQLNIIHHGHYENVFQFIEQLSVKNTVLHIYHFSMLQLVFVIQMYLFLDENVYRLMNGNTDMKSSANQPTNFN